MAYLTMMPGDAATEDKIVSAVWPRESPERGHELLEEALAEVNRAAASATGNITPVIAVPGQEPPSAPTGQAPRLEVQVFGEPCVVVYDDEERLPADDLPSGR